MIRPVTASTPLKLLLAGAALGVLLVLIWFGFGGHIDRPADQGAEPAVRGGSQPAQPAPAVASPGTASPFGSLTSSAKSPSNIPASPAPVDNGGPAEEQRIGFAPDPNNDPRVGTPPDPYYDPPVGLDPDPDNDPMVGRPPDPYYDPPVGRAPDPYYDSPVGRPPDPGRDLPIGAAPG